MTAPREVVSSSYMQWAKLRSTARFNLATSGMPNLKMRDLHVSIEDLEISYGVYGYPRLKEAIAKRYDVPFDSVVTAAGTTFANHLAMAALIKPGDEVLVEHPVYEPMLALIQYLGADVKRFPRTFENGFRISPDEVEKLTTPNTRLIVITNLHNPTGVVTDDVTIKRLGEIAKAVGARVLVNEIYRETLFEEPPQTAFNFGNEFVITNSLTKAFGLSGLRCGWIFAEPELAKRMWLLNDLFAATAVHAAERLSLVAMRQLPEIAARAKQLLDRNRQILNQFFDTRDDLEVVRPEFGTVMFPRLRRRTSSEELCQLLREKYETTVVPGSFFEMPNHFRVGFAGDTDFLKEGLDRVGKALNEINHR